MGEKKNLLERMAAKNLISPPNWLPGATKYLTIMGSTAYGVNRDDSDHDMYGFCIPRKEILFPHTSGYIPGFGTKPAGFDEFEQHHVFDPEAQGGKGREYDFKIMSIVKYFNLCMDGNPNMIDSIFTPERCIVISSPASNLLRENRRLFLSKKVWHTFRGYAYQQVRKMQTKEPEGTRLETVQKYGYDVKFAYHLVRLLDECHQILEEGDLDLTRSREHLKLIRDGCWTQEQVMQYFEDKSRVLESVYDKSMLPMIPDENAIKKVLTRCLEIEYTNVQDCVTEQGSEKEALKEIRDILDRYRI